MISVVTATYNREKMLPNLYDSLVENYNNFKDFEWIIIDDGSIDKTKQLVEMWQKNELFKIKYYKQDNQGKMKAINNAIKYVDGDIMLEVDSDDYLVSNALKIINDDYKSLGDNNVYGILYKKKLNGKEVELTKGLDGKIFTLFDIHNKYGLDVDMCLTFKTDVRKKYYYELEKKEKFVTEARLYYKLDQFYDGLLVKDKDIMCCEYLEDGYSSDISNIFKKYPNGYYAYFRECLNYIKSDTLFKRRMYFIKHYILFSYLTNKSMIRCINGAKGFNKLLVIMLVLPGYIKSSRF